MSQLCMLFHTGRFLQQMNRRRSGDETIAELSSEKRWFCIVTCAWPSPEEDKMTKIKEFLGLRAGSDAAISDDDQVATIRFSDLEVKVGNPNPALGATQVESFTLQLSE